MKVLLTNDDGIGAEGLHAIRRALLEIESIELGVIAPDSNRSATARSITTRAPLTVDEVSFGDGPSGFATDGTPVDCVRFAELGLLGWRPDLIVSGINHGSNLGDDITYSGTVAAALEGIVLGIPAIAISQQSKSLEMDFRYGREFDFGVAAGFSARLAARLGETPIPDGTLININVPGSDPAGVEVTHLGKRVYNDELKPVGRDKKGRRRFQIYGYMPSHEEQPGSDLSAVAAGRISVTPVHFDLTYESGLDHLREWGLDALLDAVRARAG